MQGKIIFITGTDTGVGKTVFTLYFIKYLKEQGLRVAALKPFSSGGREDAISLWEAAGSGLSLDEVNPYWSAEPLAPGAVKTLHGNWTDLSELAAKIRRVATGYDVTLVEGIGGVCVPLPGLGLVSDLIGALNCGVVLVSKNTLGTLNHTILSVRELRRVECRVGVVVLMDFFASDVSAKTNRIVLSQHLLDVYVIAYPTMGEEGACKPKVRRIEKLMKKTLASF